MYLKPGVFSNDGDPTDPINNVADKLNPFHPPFNKVSRYRDPGRVNLNTIYDPIVWEALMDEYAPFGPAWGGLVASRRGFGAAADGIWTRNPNVPTIFANPFRGERAGVLAPLGTLERTDVECTLLRSDGTPTQLPLFNHVSDAQAQYNDTDRSPYFRYQNITRLSNLVTTHSNVYAIWITVGFFEVEPHPTGPDVAHPDGYQLGRELGSDAGKVKRHRAFYMIDRTIPVAFEPGENHNVDRAVLLRRFIE